MIVPLLVFVSCCGAVGWVLVLFLSIKLFETHHNNASMECVVKSQGMEILERDQMIRRLEDKLSSIGSIIAPGLGESGSGVHGLHCYPCGCGCDEAVSETVKETGG